MDANFDPNVSKEDLQKALQTHCNTTKRQLKEAGVFSGPKPPRKRDNSKLDPCSWGDSKAAKILVEICKEQNLRTKKISKIYHSFTRATTILVTLAIQYPANAYFAARVLKDFIYREHKKRASQLEPKVSAFLLNILKVEYTRSLRIIEKCRNEYAQRKLIADRQLNEQYKNKIQMPPPTPEM